MSSDPGSREARDRAPVALLTGAGRGIGRAVALRLAGAGWRLEACNLDEDELDSLKEELPDGSLVHAEAFDLADRAATAAWLEGLRSRTKELRALVLVAGVGGPDPEGDRETLAHLDRVLEVNAGANHRLLRELSGLLPRDGRGRVVLVASVLGKMGVPGFSAYCASKAAAIGLVRAAALDLAPARITVNAVCPGWTDTAMARQGFEALASASGTTPEEARRRVEEGLPLGRIVRPEEVAGLVAFLLSEDAAAMTGQALTMAAGDLQR